MKEPTVTVECQQLEMIRLHVWRLQKENKKERAERIDFIMKLLSDVRDSEGSWTKQ